MSRGDAAHAYYIPEIGGSNATALAENYRKLATQITQHDGNIGQGLALM